MDSAEKRKIFLGGFASRNLQKEYEVVPELQRAKISFNDMIKCLKTRFQTASNTTLANFEFYKIHQHEEESFDAFTVMARDQIIIGTTSDGYMKTRPEESMEFK